MSTNSLMLYFFSFSLINSKAIFVGGMPDESELSSLPAHPQAQALGHYRNKIIYCTNYLSTNATDNRSQQRNRIALNKVNKIKCNLNEVSTLKQKLQPEKARVIPSGILEDEVLEVAMAIQCRQCLEGQVFSEAHDNTGLTDMSLFIQKHQSRSNIIKHKNPICSYMRPGMGDSLVSEPPQQHTLFTSHNNL